MSNGRRPVHALTSLHRGAILTDPVKIQKDLERMHPDRSGGLGVARVVNLDYEEFFVTLRTVSGTEQQFERVPVPLTFPGVGCRHFFGAMPEIGDYCIVGWMPQESTERDNGTRTPVILSWVVPGVWPGKEWVTSAAFTEEEHAASSGREREPLRGAYERIRHKLRHIQPGNIVASSSQGSDLVLDEGVTLANRRGNEIRLRDQDQALVVRSLQQFHAMAGARVYSGMVQRDATFLPTTMFSDGKEWDGARQTLGGDPIRQDLLPPSPEPDGLLTPAGPLGRAFVEAGLTEPFIQLPEYLDPFVFLKNGGYIDEDGMAVDNRHQADAVYGGKSIFRVAAQGTNNAVLAADTPTFTEYRIEVAHTSDGRLPVTDQTDMFDAERLPPSDPDTPGSSPNVPYIEWVLGSVVGNDPFSVRGRREYGLPLVAEVFDGTGGVSPRISPARVSTSGSATPVGEHAATLFRITPIGGKSAPTWWSVNKKGQVRAHLAGPPGESSLDLVLAGGLRLAIGGELSLQMRGGIHLGTQSKNSLRLRSEQGPVVIYGGGSDQDTESTMERLTGSNGGEGTTPSVDIHARTNARLRAEKKVLVKGQAVELNASSVQVNGHNEIALVSAKRITQSAEVVTVAVAGKRQDSFTGPKMLLPTNGALHERTYTPLFPGMTCEEVVYNMGDRKERFNLGSHETTVLIGNMTHQTLLGTFTARAMTSQLGLGPTGITGVALAGNVSLAATAGAAMMTATAGVILQATAGPAVVRSSSMVYLGAPPTGTDIGPVLCAGTREPFTNLPFATWGLGAKTVIVGP